jgi:transposase-like protein
MSTKPATLIEAVRQYADPDQALNEVADSRWKENVTCPHCQAEKPMFLKTRRIWKCSKCRKQFSIKAGTVFEDSPIPLDKWLPAVWLIANNRNGISSWELHRALGVTQKTAWFILHRVRLAMQDDLTGGSLGGKVEIDETFIGGSVRNMHKARKRKVQKEGRNTGGKTVVLGMLERASENKPKRIRATVIGDRKKASIVPEVAGNVEPGSHLMSDEWGNHWIDGLDESYMHQSVNHLQAYVNGNVHTNGLENFWSLLKRGVNGTYVSVEPFHLCRYVDEQAFRFNNRLHEDGSVISDYERFKTALSQIVGKRLTYQSLIGKEGQRLTEETPF